MNDIQTRIERLTSRVAGHLESGENPLLTGQDCADIAAVLSELYRVRGENTLWEQKASRLYDLLHESAQWIPRDQQDLYDRVTHELDSGLRYLDDTPIGDA